ncbi:hypothetical protein HYH03_015837 [Edaphochlamys debaryana]|uniref:Uncharacterized protein n=1 Tax=Edaphochlamys debaryana TaxID=47281 RepID=A0A835XL71_9CHLO|nr:hypothetical protein HYH03_015837 [Edaphochlamys debaryana]|eukprot:KAG2485460.1 hypothetical protein HYH03_015837 [Edaphochlamys debaryana]
MASKQGAAGGTEAEAEAGAGPCARTVQVRYGVRLHGWADEVFRLDPPPAGSLSPDSPLFPPPPEGHTYVGWYGGHRGPGVNGNKVPRKFAVPCPWVSACGPHCGAGPRCVVARTQGQAVGQTVPVLDMGPVLGPLVKRHLASLPEGPEREQERACFCTEGGGMRSVEEVADEDLARILPKLTWRLLRKAYSTNQGPRYIMQTHLTRYHFGHLPPQLRTEQGTHLGSLDASKPPWEPGTAPDADVLAARAAGLEVESYYQQVVERRRGQQEASQAPEAEAGAGPCARPAEGGRGGCRVPIHVWADEVFRLDPPPAGSPSPDSPLFPPPPEGETYVGWYGGHRGPGRGEKLLRKFAIPCPWVSACGPHCGAGPRCVVARTQGQAVGRTVPVLDMAQVLGPLVERHLASLPEGPEREQERACFCTEGGCVRSVEEVADGDLARVLPKVTWRFLREVLPARTGPRCALQAHLARFHFGHLPPQLRTEQGTRLGTEDRNRLPWQPGTSPDADVLAARAAGLDVESYYQVSIGSAPGAEEEAPDAGAAAGRPAKRQRTATADQPAADSAAAGAGPSGQARGGGGGAPSAAAAGVAMTAEGGGPATAGPSDQTAGPLQLSPAGVLLYLLTSASAARKRGGGAGPARAAGGADCGATLAAPSEAAAGPVAVQPDTPCQPRRAVSLSPPPMAGADGAAGAAQVPWVLGFQPTGEEPSEPPLPAWSAPAQNPPTPDEDCVLRSRDPRKRGRFARAEPPPTAAVDAAAMALLGLSASVGPSQLTGPGPPAEGLASGEDGAHSAHGSSSGDAGLSVVHASSASLSAPEVCAPPDVGGLSAITPGTAPTSFPAARRPGGPAIPNMPGSFEDWAAAAQAAASAQPQRLGVPGALRQAAAAAAGAAAGAAAEAAAAAAGLGPSPPAPSAASQRPSQGLRPHGLTVAGAALLQQMRRTAEAVAGSAPHPASGPLRAEGISPSCAGQTPALAAAAPGPASAQPLAASASALASSRAAAREVPVNSPGCTAEQSQQPAPVRDFDAMLAAAGHSGPSRVCMPGPSTGPAGAAAGPGAAHPHAGGSLQGDLEGSAAPAGYRGGFVLASTSATPSPTLWEGHVDLAAQPAPVRARSVAAEGDTNAEQPQRDAAEAEADAASALDLRLQPARAAAAEVRQRRVVIEAAARERGAQTARQHAEALSKERWRREAAEAAQRWESEATASTLATAETAPAAGLAASEGAQAAAQACASGLKGTLAAVEAATRNEAAGLAAAEASRAAATKRTAVLEGQLAAAEAAAASERRPVADAGAATQRELQKARADAAAAEAAVATVSRAAAVAGMASQRAVQQARAEVAAAETAAASERRAAAESRAFAQRELQRARAEVAEERQRSAAVITAVREQAEEVGRRHAAALAAAQGALESERQARAAAERQLAAAQEAAQAAATASREREEQARRELAAAQAARAALEQQLAAARAQGEQRQALYARAMRLMEAASSVGQGSVAPGAGGKA